MLEELREKEAAIEKDNLDGIKAEARYVTINELFVNNYSRFRMVSLSRDTGLPSALSWPRLRFCLLVPW